MARQMTILALSIATPCSPPIFSPAASEQEQEKGRADEGGKDANGQHGGRNEDPRQQIGERQEDGPGQRGSRKQETMTRAEQQAHGMRRDKADKADQAANGDGGSGEQRSDDDDEQFAPLHVKAQVRRALLTKRKGIEHS